MSVPVPPDAVRVWRGFRNAAKTQTELWDFLGQIYVPLEAQLRVGSGLTAYIMALPPANKTASTPDEVALIFYRSQAIYEAGANTNSSRIYSTLPAPFFDYGQAQVRSGSGFPILLTGFAEFDQPYHLFTREVDWQQGVVRVAVGDREGHRDAETFRTEMSNLLLEIQARQWPGLEAAIAVVSHDYAVYWDCWSSEEDIVKAAADDPRDYVQVLLVNTLLATATPMAHTASIYDDDSGLALGGGDCLNLQFPRAELGAPSSSS